MKTTTDLSCACGQVHLEVEGTPILNVECCCNSCRTAGVAFQRLPSAPSVVDSKGATRFVLYRKDRVAFAKGAAHLKEFRLAPDSKTRRVIASCCNTPVFLEFQSGHWLSIYGGLWPDGTLPALEMRSMTIDRPKGTRRRSERRTTVLRLHGQAPGRVGCDGIQGAQDHRGFKLSALRQ